MHAEAGRRQVSGHAVLIAGAGPAGLMLAGELALAGVDVAIVERRASRHVAGSRSGGLHSRTIEVLDQRGIAERFLARGQAMQVGSFSMIPLDISDFPTRHNYGLALWQDGFEEILAAWVDELRVPVHRGREVTGLAQDGAGVEVELGDGSSLRTRYLVGCDGGRSVVRKAAGIEFPGWEASGSSLIGEVEMTGDPELGVRRDHRGQHGLGRLDDGRVRAVVREERLGPTGEPTLEELSRALVAVWGTDYGAHSPTWISRFTDATRQAASYRRGRVLIAGDAAHVHSPIGGQGLNLGVQDAVNLGWKLARVVRGTSPDGLLDTYHAERHPVGARVLRYTMAMTALARSEARIDALRETLSDLVAMEEPRRQLAARVSGLDIHYDLGPGHPLLGRRMPDLDLVTASGPRRLFTLMHAARPLLLELDGGRDGSDVAPWADRVQLVEAEALGPWELPVLGAVAAPTAVLVRPDGHVAWVGEQGARTGLGDALATWFGPPARGRQTTVAPSAERRPSRGLM
jgi:3-(3-hydroxy-phenyl)propionate hydroxylase